MDSRGHRMKVIQLVFPEGKRKAFTISYDDGVKQDGRLLSLMKEYGIRGTFNLNAGLLGKEERAIIDGFDTDITKYKEEEIEAIYEGQEVASHALTHMKLTDISTQTMTYQVIADREKLEHITGELVQGFAYPFGAYDDTVIQALEACGIEYARTVERTGSFDLPTHFLRWHPTCHHNDVELMKLMEKFVKQDGLFGQPQLFYLWGHSYEFDQRNNWDVIEKAFAYLEPFKDSIWRATNGEICHYVSQFKKLKFSADGHIVYNPTSCHLWISVDDVIYQIGAGQKLHISIKSCDFSAK
jgi:hypothetical protein